jgi:hypothetical protein
MRRSAIAILALTFSPACATVPTVAADLPAGRHIGEYVASRPIHTFAEIDRSPADFFDQTLLVRARVTGVCESMGCWMQIEDGGRRAMVRWEADCDGKFTFPKNSIGQEILIQGSFYPKVMSDEEHSHLMSEAGAGVEIEKEGYEFNASAVVVLER